VLALIGWVRYALTTTRARPSTPASTPKQVDTLKEAGGRPIPGTGRGRRRRTKELPHRRETKVAEWPSKAAKSELPCGQVQLPAAARELRIAQLSCYEPISPDSIKLKEQKKKNKKK
jgi:hypothetical protein